MVRELTQDEYDYFIQAGHLNKKQFGMGEIEKMFAIYNDVFNARERPTTCGSCVRRVAESISYIIKNSPYYRMN
jgi:hypothetical protein